MIKEDGNDPEKYTITRRSKKKVIGKEQQHQHIEYSQPERAVPLTLDPPQSWEAPILNNDHDYGHRVAGWVTNQDPVEMENIVVYSSCSSPSCNGTTSVSYCSEGTQCVPNRYSMMQQSPVYTPHDSPIYQPSTPELSIANVNFCDLPSANGRIPRMTSSYNPNSNVQTFTSHTPTYSVSVQVTPPPTPPESVAVEEASSITGLDLLAIAAVQQSESNTESTRSQSSGMPVTHPTYLNL